MSAADRLAALDAAAWKSAEGWQRSTGALERALPALVELVRAADMATNAGHHFLCSWPAGPCDCYQSSLRAALAALDAVLP